MGAFPKRLASVLATLAMLGALWIVTPGQVQAATTVVDGHTRESGVVPGQVLVQLKSGFPDISVRRAFGAAHRMWEDQAIPGLNWFVYKYSDGTNPRAKVVELRNDPDVANVSVNVGFKLHWVPNDPLPSAVGTTEDQRPGGVGPVCGYEEICCVDRQWRDHGQLSRARGNSRS